MEKLNVLYEDNHIIVLEKKSGILSQADKSGDVDMLTLVKSYIKEKYDKKGEVFLGLVHRLDTLTSGIMVFARTSKAASRLSDDIRQGKMYKKYLAVFEEVMENKVKMILVSHKDRFVRFGFDWFEKFCNKFNVEIVVVKNEKLSPHEELVQDMVSILHVFSCRLYGLRKYKKQIEGDASIAKGIQDRDSPNERAERENHPLHRNR